MRIPRHRTPVFSANQFVTAVATAATVLLPTVGRAQDDRPALSFVRPSLDLTWTAGAPDARGDGAAMSGVGLDAVVRVGARGSAGAFHFQFAPAFIIDGNDAHQTYPSGDAARNVFASPFYFGDRSADLPSRPGQEALMRAALGESGVWWTDQRAFVGVLATTPQWGPTRAPPNWGPNRARGAESRTGRWSDHAFGEGLVLGRSAPGLPRLEAAYAWRFASTGVPSNTSPSAPSSAPSNALPNAPPSTKSSALRVRWFAGLAQESDWFDDDPNNDTRLVSGARVEYDRDDWLAVGVARTAMSAPGRGTLAAALQPFTKRSAGDEPVIEFMSADLLLTFAESGTSTWVELARQEPIRGVREFLRFPTEGIAFRAGLTQRLRRTPSADWYGSVEFVRLDQSGTSTGAAPSDLYTSAGVVHGWTHRGQPLGSGLGPGGQRQFAQLERVGSTWRLGAFVERVRWNEDALFRQPTPASDLHDVTVQVGFQAERRFGGYDVAARLSTGQRLNYLFQGASATASGEPVDLGLFRVGLSFRPAADVPRRIVGLLSRP